MKGQLYRMSGQGDNWATLQEYGQNGGYLCFDKGIGWRPTIGTAKVSKMDLEKRIQKLKIELEYYENALQNY